MILKIPHETFLRNTLYFFFTLVGRFFSGQALFEQHLCHFSIDFSYLHHSSGSGTGGTEALKKKKNKDHLSTVSFCRRGVNDNGPTILDHHYSFFLLILLNHFLRMGVSDRKA